MGGVLNGWREVARVAGSYGVITGGSCLEAVGCVPAVIAGIRTLGWRVIEAGGAVLSDVEEIGSVA